MNHDRIETTVSDLMTRLPKPVAARVREKYEEDREEYLQVVEDMRPSSKASYWAKPSCTKCHGRGIIGDKVLSDGTKQSISCSCMEKRYQKWLVDVRKYYLALKAQNRRSVGDE